MRSKKKKKKKKTCLVVGSMQTKRPRASPPSQAPRAVDIIKEELLAATKKMTSILRSKANKNSKIIILVLE